MSGKNVFLLTGKKRNREGRLWQRIIYILELTWSDMDSDKSKNCIFS